MKNYITSSKPLQKLALDNIEPDLVIDIFDDEEIRQKYGCFTNFRINEELGKKRPKDFKVEKLYFYKKVNLIK